MLQFLPLALLAFQAHDGSSGGALTTAQAAYDVQRYDLSLALDPAERTIEGTLTVIADVVAPLEELVLDLDDALKVRGVHEGGRPLEWSHVAGVLRIALGSKRASGAQLAVAVDYGGSPRVAQRPPWEGGFTWSETPAGAPWVTTSCQQEGADLWWPCKDHPGDEPERMDLHIRVPRPLVVATNGELSKKETHADGTWTWHWHVSTPINNYGVALNVAPYIELKADYTSTAGTPLPITLYVLPSSVEQGRAFLPEIVQHLRWFEETFGPYPFRADKYAVVETPYLGMEHQTIIAYGNEFKTDRRGFDWLHHHELAHEWWGNLVTAADWKDFWIHEGFATYCQNLYGEHLKGPEELFASVRRMRRGLNNEKPVAPLTTCTTKQIYFNPGGGYDNDVYYKAALVLHTLRFVIGDEAFFRALRRMSYPDPALEQVTGGEQCRFVTTADFVTIAERESGRELDWFFDVYLHRSKLPELVLERSEAAFSVGWKVPGGGAFPLPIEVVIDGQRRRCQPGESVPAAPDALLEPDPDGWVLRAR